MKHTFLGTLATIAMLFLPGHQAQAAQWAMKQGPMMTTWSEKIDTAQVLPQYPRPQMQRSTWINLNGLWQLRKGTVGEAYSSNFSYDKQILVPYPIESAISGVMEKSDEQCYWYRRTFTLPKAMQGKHILLNFGAVDWQAIVYVNGTKVGEHTGGYDPFSFDITSALKPGSEQQELAVYIYDNTGAEGQPTGKQSKNPSICWYTAVSGIWQTVWLEPVEEAHISSMAIEPCVAKDWLSMRFESTVTTDVAVDVQVLDRQRQQVASLNGGKVGLTQRLTISQPHLWSPDDPYLYTLKIQLKHNGVVTDSITSYCGMRKIEVKKDAKGLPRIYLNDNQIFQMGPLDQGWWPDGLYTAPADEALLYDVQMMKRLGFNMVRKHIKIEPDRWYYYCDREGLLVWQDLPSPNLPKGHEDFAKANFEQEAINIINAKKNFPSIVQWIVFNEGWGQFDTERMTGVVDTKVNSLTPARYGKTSLIECASGWTDAEVGQTIDTHSYPQPSCPHNANRAAVCGEYGGITLKVPGHIWPGGDFQYTVVENGQDFSNFFGQLCQKIRDFYYQGLNAAVCTQLSDVEIEKNGFMTYDRKVLKPAKPFEQVRADILSCIDMPQSKTFIKPILSTAEQHTYKWHYTTANVDRHWFETTYNDSAWATGPAAFGHGMAAPYDTLVRTGWQGSQIHMRRWFWLGDITAENLAKLRFFTFHDDGIKVYINGVLAAVEQGPVFSYSPLDINDAGRAALKPKAWNLIAIDGHQDSGQQIMDLGIVAYTDVDFPYSENYDDRIDAPVATQPAPHEVDQPQYKLLSAPVPTEPAQQGGKASATRAGQFFHTVDHANAVWADLDADGNLELAYSGRNEHLASGMNQAVLYHYDGNDQFSRRESPLDVVFYACPTAIDYDNDGRLDLFVPGVKNYDYSDDLSDVVAHLYHNMGNDASGNPMFQEVNDNAAMGLQPIYNDLGGGRSRQWVSTGDYDNDGYTDLVVTGRADYADPKGALDANGKVIVHHDRRTVTLYHNNARHGFTQVEGPFVPLARGSVQFADIDGDGWLDIVSAGYSDNQGCLYIYWNNGDGTFTRSDGSLYGAYDSSCFPADFDGDGLTDILVTGFSSNKGSNAKSCFIYRNLGNRQFTMLDDSYCGFEGVDGATPDVADVNHDGLPDILIGGHGATHEITTWLYLNQGDFSFKPVGAYYDNPFGKQWTFSRISHGNDHLIDYNHDGLLDAWSMGWAQTSVCPGSCAAEIYENVSSNITPNQAPSTPTGLQCTYDAQQGRIVFTWNASTDDATSQAALRYNIFVRKQGSDSVFMTIPALLANGRLKTDVITAAIAGTTHAMSIPLTNTTYEWGVQAIDAGKASSTFATGTFNPAQLSGLAQATANGCQAHIFATAGSIRYHIVPWGHVMLYDASAALVRSFRAQGYGEISGLQRGFYMATVVAPDGNLASTFKLAI